MVPDEQVPVQGNGLKWMLLQKFKRRATEDRPTRQPTKMGFFPQASENLPKPPGGVISDHKSGASREPLAKLVNFLGEIQETSPSTEDVSSTETGSYVDEIQGSRSSHDVKIAGKRDESGGGGGTGHSSIPRISRASFKYLTGGALLACITNVIEFDSKKFVSAAH